jgi:hypothetical protein
VFEKNEAPTNAVVRARVIIPARKIAFIKDPQIFALSYALPT